MIILGEVFNNLQKRLAGLVGNSQFDLMREFKGANSDFSKQVFQLQGALMDIRRVELRNVTASLSRLVRDTASSLNKRINLQISGENAVIDKSLLDDVNACLVHIVRNACDHGIESPQEREQAGKNPEGIIEVSAENENDHLILKVADDGKGIDLERIRRKTLELGLHSEKELAEMSERQLRELVFHNGLSTATQVSDISGRGVGMSSVMENIGKNGGSIELKSELGKGTEVVMRIPLSIMLSVLDGLVVSSGGRGFILPIRSVCQTLSLQAADIISYQGKGKCIKLRSSILPILSLESYLGVGGGEGLTGVVVRSGEGQEYCLVVDEILDHQQVVIKRIDGLEGVPGILGGALLGDGTIGLVLNSDYFASLCH
jgi:two-component system chemotaxis sensor kinase CheA